MTVSLRRQEAYFQYLFGVNDGEDFYGAFDLRSERAILFMPRLPASYAVWMGHIPTPAEAQVRALGYPCAGAAALLHGCVFRCRSGSRHTCRSNLPVPCGRAAADSHLTCEHQSASPQQPALQAKYAVDEVRHVDELAAVLAELAAPCLHVLDGGVNTDRRASTSSLPCLP